LALFRSALLKAINTGCAQYVLGQDLNMAQLRGKAQERKGYLLSYDRLAEAALSEKDVERYFQDYLNTISALGCHTISTDPLKNPSVSIKLAALHPCLDPSQSERVFNAVVPRLLAIALAAKDHHLSICVAAEEADRLELFLDIIEAVFCDPQLKGYEGFGLTVQAYQKRAPYVVDWLAELARQQKRRIVIRLVKGAYWDHEIQSSQDLGLGDCPVFTSKQATDVSFMACAQKMLTMTDIIYPQFGTHNAHSVAAILEMAPINCEMEFHCLCGMGTVLYGQLVSMGKRCRIHAPFGSPQDTCAYFVRRLVEYGANTSFVNRCADTRLPMTQLLTDPVVQVAHYLKSEIPALKVEGGSQPN
jgi:RHH-type proline utilization regulon transcriptional repressor/proline dehydrogenase/delta 1-pyrroline-5-carboxylate dehydrogenase